MLSRDAAVAALYPSIDNARAAIVHAFCVRSGWIAAPGGGGVKRERE